MSLVKCHTPLDVKLHWAQCVKSRWNHFQLARYRPLKLCLICRWELPLMVAIWQENMGREEKLTGGRGGWTPEVGGSDTHTHTWKPANMVTHCGLVTPSLFVSLLWHRAVTWTNGVLWHPHENHFTHGCPGYNSLAFLLGIGQWLFSG